LSARTLYALFDRGGDVCLAFYQVLAARLQAEMEVAWSRDEDWATGVRATIATALAFAVREPDAARFLAVEVQAGGPKALAAQAASVDCLAAKLREGHRLYPRAAGLNRYAEQVLVAGPVSLVGNRLLAGRADRLPALEPELVELVLAPYLGAERARGLAAA
jgi:hypothetical protein